MLEALGGEMSMDIKARIEILSVILGESAVPETQPSETEKLL